MFINCKGKLLSLQQPLVMGILNCTPDSFYSASRKQTEKEVLSACEAMLLEGAAIIDIGAYSSRPGATEVTEEEEWERLAPALKSITSHFRDCIISIDTFRASVAEKAVHEGASMINDISAGEDDPAMLETVGRLQLPYIAMHKRGNPQTMNSLTDYENVVMEVYDYLSAKINTLKQYHLHDIIIDPGFGFAKNLSQNLELLQGLGIFKQLNTPLLVGISRKKMLKNIIGAASEDALNATTVANTIVLIKGADILRVHDVREAVECIKIVGALQAVQG
jgi:dihydropteroate synthase